MCYASHFHCCTVHGCKHAIASVYCMPTQSERQACNLAHYACDLGGPPPMCMAVQAASFIVQVQYIICIVHVHSNTVRTEQHAQCIINRDCCCPECPL